MRQKLEQHQIWLYLIAIIVGMVIGHFWHQITASFEILLWPVLAILLYSTFTQIPLTHIRSAFRDKRFLAAIAIGNFIIIPILVWLLSRLLPTDSALLLGFFLVLLVPCTDWFISFTHIGKGDSARAIAISPILLLLQVGLLPVYLHFFMGEQLVGMAILPTLLQAFFFLIVMPLILAWLTERYASKRPAIQSSIDFLGWLPIPALTITVFLIAATQVNVVLNSGSQLWLLAFVFTLYLIAVAILGKMLGNLFSLPAQSARTLTFSFGTRNSFVVLPLAIALPEIWAAAIVVIVFQSLVELFGMIAFMKFMPRWIPSSP